MAYIKTRKGTKITVNVVPETEPGWIYSLMFWGFIVIKVAGHMFNDWSWLWIFLPFVPWIGVAIKYFGL